MLLFVCDATPLISLGRLGRFELLHTFHERVLVPPAVWNEVAGIGKGLPGEYEMKSAVAGGWLVVNGPERSLRADPNDIEDLDPGEAEAIQLATESNAVLAIDGESP